VVVALWAAALAASGVMLAEISDRVAAPGVTVPGSESQRAARVLQERFGIQSRAPQAGGRISSTPGGSLARAMLLAIPLSAVVVLIATRSAAAALTLGALQVATVMVAVGLVLVLPGVAPPHPLAPVIAAAVGGGAALWLSMAAASRPSAELGSAGVAASGFVALLLAPIPALRSLGAAGAIGAAVAAVAVASAATVGRGGHPPAARDGRHRLGPERAAGVAAAILVASTAPLAALRLDPLGLVAAPPGIQIVIQDPRGLRGEGFPAVYGQVQRLLDDPEVADVRSIANLVAGASLEQARAFLQSPLGTDPSEPLLTTDERTTRIVVSPAHGPRSPEAVALVDRIRARPAAPPGGAALVGGEVAGAADLDHAARGALVPVSVAALGLIAGSAWWRHRRGRTALAAAAAGGIAGVAGLGLTTVVVQFGLGSAGLLPLAPPLIVAGGAGLGAALAVTADDPLPLHWAAAGTLAWAGVTGSGALTLVVGLGASAALGLLARRVVAIERPLPANR
jgi:hypothetical protein